MNQDYELQEDLECDIYDRMQRLIEINPWAWQSIGAVSGLVGGILTPILGTLLIAVAWFIHSQWVVSSLNGLSIVCFVLTIPLLTFGAYCLDLLGRRTAGLSLTEKQPSQGLTFTSSGMRDTEEGTRRRCKLIGGSVALAFLFGLPASGYAQQTVFNVPTTDVLDKGKIYFELDISARPNEPRFSSFVPRVVVGTGKRVEVGLNVTGNIQPGADTMTLVPAVKWKVYDGGDKGWAIAVGNNLFIPVRNRSYDLGTYSYTIVQKTFITKTRIGAGGYFFSKNVVAPNANRAGGLFTIEQPITKRFGLQADWVTGKQGSGYFTPGGYLKFTRKITGYAAYSIGNANVSNGNHFFYFEVGYNFN
ncbi:MAG: hypothetical protein H0V18_00865 [Pyrinomonadaceae bacterium]|nr:hypothetical protein [Pyrinomonadaceae bacterium]